MIRRGRPRKDDAERRRPRWSVLLDRDTEDALCRLALRHGVSVHKLLKLAAKRLVDRDATIPFIQP